MHTRKFLSLIFDCTDAMVIRRTLRNLRSLNSSLFFLEETGFFFSFIIRGRKTSYKIIIRAARKKIVMRRESERKKKKKMNKNRRGVGRCKVKQRRRNSLSIT